MANEVRAIVIDNGSATVKAGFAGEDVPRIVFPSIVGYPKECANTTLSYSNNSYIGDKALTVSKTALSLTYPIQYGIIFNWESMEKIWQHVFSELRASPQDQPVLLTEVATNPKVNREKMTQIMFESFNTPGVYIATQGVLGLYAAARLDGVVIDCGHSVCYVVPVSGGYSLPHAVLKTDLAGESLTNFLSDLLAKRGYTSDRKVIRDIKETLCYVSLDFEQEMRASSNETTYESNGQRITIGKELFSCPEALFTPSLLNLPYDGIHVMTNNSIKNCDQPIRNDLYANLVLAGGTSMLPGFAERMKKELMLLAPNITRINVVAFPDRKFQAWVGGSILAAMSTFQQMYITKEEYQEWGPVIVHRKCYT